MVCLHQTPPLGPQGSLKKRRQKARESWKWWRTSRKPCLQDTAGLMHTHTHRDGSLPRACAAHARRKSQQWEGGPRLYKRISSTDSCWQRENLFSVMESHWYIKYIPGQAPCPNSVVLLLRFVLHFGIFCLIGVLFVYVFCFPLLCFYVCFERERGRKRETTWSWMNREVGRTWELGERKHAQNL